MSHRRKGKVAQLSYELRQKVNGWLRDGIPYKAIAGLLTAEGQPGFTEMNLSNWKDGGHQDWLAEQGRLEQMQARREFAAEIAKQNEGGKVAEAGLQIAASQIYDILSDFDPEIIRKMIQTDPENYARIVTALARVSKEALGFEKFREEVRAKFKEVKDEVKRGGLTAATIERIERELKLL